MFKKASVVLISSCVLAACAASSPRIIQTSSGATDIRITRGMATQVEMPDAGRVQSVSVGNPDLVTVDQAGDVVNLVAKGGVGETNLIIRSSNEDNHTQVYQYRITVQ